VDFRDDSEVFFREGTVFEIRTVQSVDYSLFLLHYGGSVIFLYSLDFFVFIFGSECIHLDCTISITDQTRELHALRSASSYIAVICPLKCALDDLLVF
jgi:hypothetical protein